LLHIINEINHGRGKDIDELRDIAQQLIEQLKDYMPAILDEINNNDMQTRFSPKHRKADSNNDNLNRSASVRLVSSMSNQKRAFVLAHLINNNIPIQQLESILENDALVSDIISDIVNKFRARELEQLCYTFAISNITLAGITHIVRHRMQSIVIPPVADVDITKFIIPNTVIDSGDLHYRYMEIYKNTANLYAEMCNDGFTSAQLSYLALSGNVFDVLTTMNARELRWFISIRSCQRAQWEIRKIAIAMLKLAQDELPELFNLFGPSCYLRGVCPEDSLSCGDMQSVKSIFANLNRNKQTQN
jgi:thymidylate synthase (FAD)